MRPGRAGGAPRAAVALTLLVAAAAAGLWWLTNRETAPDLTLGGPVFAVEADDIEGLLLARHGRQFRFDRHPSGVWTLSGAADDFLDPDGMAALVRDLLAAGGGRLLPGTEPDDRRYGFSGAEGVRLTLLLQGGATESLSLGDANPVTGYHFASGAGRDACFPVTAEFRRRLVELPGSVQHRRLLPLDDPDAVTGVLVERGRLQDRLEKTDGRWWLAGPVDLDTSPAGAYQEFYDDRRRVDGGRVWYQADEDRVRALIHEVGATVVRQVLPLEETPARAAAWELDPPWRRVTLLGPGLNPEPEGDRDRLTIAFGPPLDPKIVPARRRGHLLLTESQAVASLDRPAVEWLDVHAVPSPVLTADTLRVWREERLLVHGVRTDAEVVADGREAWETRSPAPVPAGMPEADRQGLTRNLVVDLGRIAIEAVLPPTNDAAVLRPDERVRVELGRAGAAPLVYEFGRLDPRRLPAGAAPVGENPVGLWIPATGQLLQVDDAMIVTARSMARVIPGGTTD